MSENLKSIMSFYINKNLTSNMWSRFCLFWLFLLLFSSGHTAFKVIRDFWNACLCVCSSDNWDPRSWLIMFLWHKVKKDYLALILVSCIVRLNFTQGFCVSYLHAESSCLCLAKHNFLSVSKLYLNLSKNQTFLQFL